MTVAIRIENLSKLYRLGTVGTGTISHDINRWWHTVRGKKDPYTKVGQVNDRTQASAKNHERGSKNSEATDYVWALRDIHLEVQQGEILGIIGRNGAGKSTLLKLLSRVTAPTTGSIKSKGRIASLLEVGTGFHPELTGRENIYMNGAILGMRRHEIAKQLEQIAEFSGCDMYLDTPVKRYSSGMMVRLGFAVAAHLECEILIVDEVLAVGDAEFQAKCIGKMNEVSRSGRSILFVSHNMGAISELCESAVFMRDGVIKVAGTVDDCMDQYLQIQVRPEQAVIHLQQTDPSFWLKRVRLLNIHETETNHFGVNSPISLEFAYSVHGRIENVELGFQVSTSRGTKIFTSTFPIPTASDSKKGSVAVAKIPAHFLTPGQFLVTVAAHIPGQAVINIAEDALSMTIEETGSVHSRYQSHDHGVVFAECDWMHRENDSCIEMP